MGSKGEILLGREEFKEVNKNFSLKFEEVKCWHRSVFLKSKNGALSWLLRQYLETSKAESFRKQLLQVVQLKLQRHKIPVRHRKFLGEYKNFMSQKIKIPLNT